MWSNSIMAQATKSNYNILCTCKASPEWMASSKRHPVLKTCLGTLMLPHNSEKKGSADAKGYVTEIVEELVSLDVAGGTPTPGPEV